MIEWSRKNIAYTVLAGFFITNAIVAEFIGGKMIKIGGYTVSVGIIPWPFVFVLTDVINEHFGRKGVRRITIITAILIVYAYFILQMAISTPIDAINSPVDQNSFNTVFGTSSLIIVGSVTAFIVSQLLDVTVFWIIRNITGKKMIWARATGSTIVSQLIDSYVVTFIAFVLPGILGIHSGSNLYWDIPTWISISFNNYTVKLFIAVLITPLIYVVHWIVDWYLGKEVAQEASPQNSEGS